MERHAVTAIDALDVVYALGQYVDILVYAAVAAATTLGIIAARIAANNRRIRRAEAARAERLARRRERETAELESWTGQHFPTGRPYSPSERRNDTPRHLRG